MHNLVHIDEQTQVHSAQSSHSSTNRADVTQLQWQSHRASIGRNYGPRYLETVIVTDRLDSASVWASRDCDHDWQTGLHFKNIKGIQLINHMQTSKRFSSFLLNGMPSSLLMSWATPMTCPRADLIGMQRIDRVRKPSLSTCHENKDTLTHWSN